MRQEILLDPLNRLWETVAMGLPKLILAIIIFVIGWILAGLVYKLLVKVSKSLRLDHILKPTGLPQAVERTGHKFSVGAVLGFLVKWFIIITFLMAALDTLGLQSTTGLLTGIINYIPQVIIAVLVMLAGVALAGFVKKLVMGSTKMLNVKSAGVLSNVAKVAVLVFTVIIVLNLLGIGRELINVLFIGAVSMIALAGGLAFGLGGRDAAARAIQKAQDGLHR